MQCHRRFPQIFGALCGGGADILRLSSCGSLRCAISEELCAHSFDSWTGQGSEGARAEIEQIRNDCRMWAALAIEARDLAEIESATLGGQT